MTVPLERDDAPISTGDTVRYLLQSIGRKRIVALLGLVVAMSLFDMAGIAVIFPFLQFVTQPQSVTHLADWLGSDLIARFSHAQAVVVVGLALAVFYTVKTYIQAKFLSRQSHILARFTAETTNNVVSHVLNARYALFQETAASEVGGIAYSCTVHATLAMTALIQAANEGFVLVLLFVGFLVVEPVLALGALLFAGLAAGLLYQIVIRRSTQIGEAQSRIEIVRYRLLFSLANAIRDIKIMGLDAQFDARNRQVSAEYAELAGRYNFNVGLPRLLIEFFALLAIVGIALGVVLAQLPAERAGPLLGLIAVATVRAVPGFYRFFNSASTFRSSQPIVARLIGLLRRLAAAAVSRESDDIRFERAIELRHVGFRYEDKPVLSDICLELRRGESIGIVGSSGAGKTTLLDLITGLQPASEGEFYADGVRFDPFLSHGMQRLVGYVPQAITLFDESIAFNVSFERDADPARVMRMLEMSNLREFIDSLPQGLDTRVGENGLRLSGGQRQRIGIARALYREPRILVFDEATSALDTLSERELTTEIEKLRGSISVVIVAHRLSTVMACDRIYVLAGGVVESAGTHVELLRTSSTYRKLYNIQADMEPEGAPA